MINQFATFDNFDDDFFGYSRPMVQDFSTNMEIGVQTPQLNLDMDDQLLDKNELSLFQLDAEISAKRPL